MTLIAFATVILYSGVKEALALSDQIHLVAMLVNGVRWHGICRGRKD